MASWEEGAGFRIIGTIKRIFVAPKHNFAKVTVTVNMHPHPADHDLKTFDKALIGDVIRDLRQGQRVQFLGKIENEKLVDENKAEVKVRGYTVWMPLLRFREFEVEGSSRAPREKPADPKPGDPGDPFARADRQPGDDDGDPMGGGSAPAAGGDPMGGGSDPFGG